MGDGGHFRLEWDKNVPSQKIYLIWDLNDKKSLLQIPVFMTELLVLPGRAFWAEVNFLKRDWAWCLRGVEGGPEKQAFA